jgi:arsenate reductase-like glutaredoxin family protein
MTPQLIGSKKAKAVRAAERYCSERRLEYQLRDPREKPLSARELDTIVRALDDPMQLLDTDSKAYRKRGLRWMDFDPIEEVQEDPELLRQPIVRTDRGVAIDPDVATLDRLFGRE